MAKLLYSVLAALFAILLTSCEDSKRAPPPEAATTRAISQAEKLISDQNAVTISWYRNRLKPYYSLSSEKISISRKEAEKLRGTGYALSDIAVNSLESLISGENYYYYKPKPVIDHEIFLWPLLIYVIAIILFSFANYIADKEKDEDSITVYILISLFIISLPFILIFPIKGIVAVFWPTGHYIWWQFASIIGMSIIVISLLSVATFPVLQKTMHKTDTAFKLWATKKKKDNITISYNEKSERDTINMILNMADDLNGEDDKLVLNSINESVTDILYDNRVKKYRKDLNLLLQILERKGCRDSSLYERIKSHL